MKFATVARRSILGVVADKNRVEYSGPDIGFTKILFVHMTPSRTPMALFIPEIILTYVL